VFHILKNVLVMGNKLPVKSAHVVSNQFLQSALIGREEWIGVHPPRLYPPVMANLLQLDRHSHRYLHSHRSKDGV
jgi:hypothetical protein